MSPSSPFPFLLKILKENIQKIFLADPDSGGRKGIRFYEREWYTQYYEETYINFILFWQDDLICLPTLLSTATLPLKSNVFPENGRGLT